MWERRGDGKFLRIKRKTREEEKGRNRGENCECIINFDVIHVYR